MAERKPRKVRKAEFTADFETTSEANLEVDGYVHVWLWSLYDINNDTYEYGTSIVSFIHTVKRLKCRKIFFHNLRFDGSFIVDYLLTQGWEYGKDFECLIDGMNVWYQIHLKKEGFNCKIWDSLKKFPGQSVQSIAKMYGLEDKHDKPDFDRYFPEDYKPTKDEIEYCVHDARIIAKALKQEFYQGHKGMTLSTDAFKSVEEHIGGHHKRMVILPDLTQEQYQHLESSYKGGWTYLNPKYGNKDLKNIHVYDVNSLYPYVMKYCELPVGKPKFSRFYPSSDMYVVKCVITCTLKEGYVPTLQIKGNPLYKETEYLTKITEPTVVVLTNIDFDLLNEHYDVHTCEIVWYYSFRHTSGLLSDYIDYWTNEKIMAKKNGDNARYFISKRYLNSPYGKMGTRKLRLNKVPYMDDSGMVMFNTEISEQKGIYLPYAIFVTAQARKITIDMAQANYENFVYADTDSVHLVGKSKDGMNIDDYKLGQWKLEGVFEQGRYLRAKTYAHADNQNNVTEVKCAGMPDDVKATVNWDNFRLGQEYGNKMLQKRVPGGVLLRRTTFMISNVRSNRENTGFTVSKS